MGSRARDHPPPRGRFLQISEFLAKLLNGAEEVSMPLPGMSLDSYLLTKDRRSRRFVNAVADKPPRLSRVRRVR